MQTKRLEKGWVGAVKARVSAVSVSTDPSSGSTWKTAFPCLLFPETVEFQNCTECLGWGEDGDATFMSCILFTALSVMSCLVGLSQDFLIG